MSQVEAGSRLSSENSLLFWIIVNLVVNMWKDTSQKSRVSSLNCQCSTCGTETAQHPLTTFKFVLMAPTFVLLIFCSKLRMYSCRLASSTCHWTDKFKMPAVCQISCCLPSRHVMETWSSSCWGYQETPAGWVITSHGRCMCSIAVYIGHALDK